MTLTVRIPRSLELERRYVLEVVLGDWLGLAYEAALDDRVDVEIRSRDDPDDRALRVADVFLATAAADWLAPRSLASRPLRRVTWASRPLPVIFAAPHLGDAPWGHTDDGIDCAIDVLGSVFYLLTRYEEIVASDRDAFDRFPGSASLAAAEGFIRQAVVDDYVDILWQAMHALWPWLVRRRAAFTLRLTHDVDRPWAARGRPLGAVARSVGADLFRRRDAALAAGRLRSIVDNRSGGFDRDPFNTFDLLMEVSERHGLQGTFFFMAGATDPRYDGSYDIADPPFVRLLGEIHSRGHEVGLHTSYGTYQSPSRMRSELDALRAACQSAGFEPESWGVRQHYLRFEAPATWRCQEEAGLDYDSSLGYADMGGFRAGTCREFPVFDLIQRRQLALRERPLVAMDVTMEEYLGLEFDEIAADVGGLVAECRRHDGDAVILYHNSSLPSRRQRAHYRELIAALVDPA